MPTPAKGARLGGGPAHERLILANMAQSLFEHGRVTTTLAKAKRLRPYAERIVTFAKRGDLASRRRVLGIISDKSVVHVLFADIAPAFADRNGGYTRIVRIGNRNGDNAPMAVIELVAGADSLKQSVVAEATRAAKSSSKPTSDVDADGVATASADEKPAKAPQAAPTAKGVADKKGAERASAKSGSAKSGSAKSAAPKKAASTTAKKGAK